VCCAKAEQEGPVEDWEQLMMLAKLIPRVCHEVNRIVYVWGETVEG
jgi:GMP synthase (glutamine-hydrolysing)